MLGQVVRRVLVVALQGNEELVPDQEQHQQSQDAGAQQRAQPHPKHHEGPDTSRGRHGDPGRPGEGENQAHGQDHECHRQAELADARTAGLEKQGQ